MNLYHVFYNHKIVEPENFEVSKHVDLDGFLHQPQLLNQDESWKLLYERAFPKNRRMCNISSLVQQIINSFAYYFLFKKYACSKMTSNNNTMTSQIKAA
jgi:hypothetical protein